MRMRLVPLSLIFTTCLIGCTPSEAPKKAGNDAKPADAEVAQAFKSLQTAIKAKDADKIWDLLAKESQADAEREAKIVREAFGKAIDKEKAGFVKNLELEAQELAEITGKLYVKSRRFYGKYHEIPDSKVEKISVTGDSGTVKYIEEDGDKITQDIVREQGKWKFVMAIPKATEK